MKRPSGVSVPDARTTPPHTPHGGSMTISEELRDPPALTVVPADDSPRWSKLDALREMARQFVSHPLSRGITDCEEAGELMTEAAAEIERLCRVRNCLAGSARERTARLQQLESQRDYLLGELRRIDNDPGNSGHYASEAIAAVCAEEVSQGVRT